MLDFIAHRHDLMSVYVYILKNLHARVSNVLRIFFLILSQICYSFPSKANTLFYFYQI